MSSARKTTLERLQMLLAVSAAATAVGCPHEGAPPGGVGGYQTVDPMPGPPPRRCFADGSKLVRATVDWTGAPPPPGMGPRTVKLHVEALATPEARDVKLDAAPALRVNGGRIVSSNATPTTLDAEVALDDDADQTTVLVDNQRCDDGTQRGSLLLMISPGPDLTVTIESSVLGYY